MAYRLSHSVRPRRVAAVTAVPVAKGAGEGRRFGAAIRTGRPRSPSGPLKVDIEAVVGVDDGDEAHQPTCAVPVSVAAISGWPNDALRFP